MRKDERGEECDTTTQVFTYTSHVTIFSMHEVCTYSMDGSSLVPKSCLRFQRFLDTPLGLAVLLLVVVNQSYHADCRPRKVSSTNALLGFTNLSAR